MALWHVLVVLSVVFISSFFGTKCAVAFNDKRPRGYDTRLDLSVGCVFLICALLGACFFTHILPPSLVFTIYAILAMGIVCLVFVSPKLSKLQYLGGCFGICFLSTYFLPSSLFPDSLMLAFLKHIQLAAAWVGLMWLTAKMDRVPFFSMIFTTSIAFCVFLLSAFFSVLPVAFGYLMLTILTMQVGANLYLKRRFLPRLGIPGAALIGYFLGFFSIYLLALGQGPAVFVLYGYPLMEITLSLGASFALYQQFSLRPAFLVEQALSKNIMPSKVLQSLMIWGILLASLASLTIVSKDSMDPYVYYIALGIILANIYIRLSGWGTPRPRLRDVGHDLKEGLKEAKKEWMAIPLKPVKQKAAPSKKTVPVVPKTTKSASVKEVKPFAGKQGQSSPKKTPSKTAQKPVLASKKSPVKGRGKTTK